MGNSCRCPTLIENDDVWVDKMEKERRDGRALLTEKIHKSDSIDWPEIIRQAEFLHKREQRKLRKRERRWRRQQKKRALDRLKRYDSTGSFSVNLIHITSNNREGKAKDDKVDMINFSYISNGSSTSESNSGND